MIYKSHISRDVNLAAPKQAEATETDGLLTTVSDWRGDNFTKSDLIKPNKTKLINKRK